MRIFASAFADFEDDLAVMFQYHSRTACKLYKMMESGGISISGFWLRESNPGCPIDDIRTSWVVSRTRQPGFDSRSQNTEIRIPPDSSTRQLWNVIEVTGLSMIKTQTNPSSQHTLRGVAGGAYVNAGRSTKAPAAILVSWLLSRWSNLKTNPGQKESPDGCFRASPPTPKHNFEHFGVYANPLLHFG